MFSGLSFVLQNAFKLFATRNDFSDEFVQPFSTLMTMFERRHELASVGIYRLFKVVSVERQKPLNELDIVVAQINET